MLRQIERFIREQDLIPPGSTVLCAVSGGADSVAMLHILYRLRDKLNFTLAAAHYNHQLRGAESDRDQRFVEQFVRLCCGEHRRQDGTVLPAVPLYTGSGDVAGQARLRGAGIEETARDMRYAFLRQAAKKAGADLIATAHTASDNVETILFHLARGSGLRGLGGILPKREEIIRPLLTTTRPQVEDYLRRHSLPHMEDSSNQNDDYTRNRIRHQVLPVLEEVSPGFLARMADTAALLRADEEVLTAQARELADRAVPREGGLAIDAAIVAAAPDPIASRTLRLLLGRLWGGDQNCSAAHLNALMRLCRGDHPSGQVHLPHGTNARRDYDVLLFVPAWAPSLWRRGHWPSPVRWTVAPGGSSAPRRTTAASPRGPGTSGWTGRPSPPWVCAPGAPATGSPPRDGWARR